MFEAGNQENGPLLCIPWAEKEQVEAEVGWGPQYSSRHERRTSRLNLCLVNNAPMSASEVKSRFASENRFGKTAVIPRAGSPSQRSGSVVNRTNLDTGKLDFTEDGGESGDKFYSIIAFVKAKTFCDRSSRISNLFPGS